MRLTILDGFRGFFLLFMMVAHANGYIGAAIGHFNHHSIGWVEDAQGFVFISGLVVALVYGKKLVRKGPEALTSGVRARIRTIYTYQAAMILALLAAALLLPLIGIKAQILAQPLEEPVVFTLAELLLTTGTMHLGILPMYIFFMIATPFVLILFQRGQGALVLAASVGLWIFAQTGFPDLAQLPVEQVLAATGHPINIGIYFNIFAWQALFVAGLWIGWLMVTERLNLALLRQPVMTQVFFVALAVFAVLGVLQVMNWTGAGPENWRKMMFTYIDRGNLAWIYVLAFAVDLFIFAWLVNAAHASGWRGLAAAGRAVTWVFTRPFLVKLGQHSLQVFAAHVIVVYIVAIWLENRGAPLSPMGANLALILSIVPLYIVAMLHEGMKARRAPAPKTRTIPAE